MGVTFPLGLLIERWFLYYYPIFESEVFIPQMGADTGFLKKRNERPKFRTVFDPVISYYRKNGGGFSKCYTDYQKGRIPLEIRGDFLRMCHRIRDTIVDMPMYHLGYSLHQQPNEIFTARKGRLGRDRNEPVDPSFLIKNFGEFTIRVEYYRALRNAGPFLIGDNSILFRWAQFSERRIEGRIRFGDILRTIAEYPVEERDIADAKRFYDHLRGNHVPLISVWSGRTIRSVDQLAMDHLVPFSVWKNNDLWNLLPSLQTENSQKSDRIPHPLMLESRKEIITGYWSRMMDYDPPLFTRQIKYALIGSDFDRDNWQDKAFDNLVDKCRHMIDVLGYTSWNNT